MVAVAEKMSFSAYQLVPFELTTARWVSQYPESSPVFVPTFADVLASTVAADTCLRVPVAPPPKRGRPSNKRKISALGIISKRLRANAGNWGTKR